jgi:EpsI family protein
MIHALTPRLHAVPRAHWLLLVLMLGAALLAAAMRPTIVLADERAPIALEAMVPAQFGGWREQPNAAMHIIDPELQATIDQIYTEVLTRNYVGPNGERVMLSIAYGRDQRDGLQLHLPEVCYPAQGFRLKDIHEAPLALPGGTITVRRMATQLAQRFEPVTYWTVVGDHVTTGGLSKKLVEMRYSLFGRIPDGMLVRISSIDRDNAHAFAVHAKFAAAMVGAIAAEHRPRFAGVHAEALAAAAAPPAAATGAVR